MKQLTTILILLLSSCMMDSFDYFCYVKNTSKRKITIRFSNSETIDTSALVNENWDLGINPGNTHRVNKDPAILHKEFYTDSNKKLYVYFFDQDSLHQLYKNGKMNDMFKQSFLQRQEVDIIKLKESDTLKYNEIIK